MILNDTGRLGNQDLKNLERDEGKALVDLQSMDYSFCNQIQQHKEKLLERRCFGELLIKITIIQSRLRSSRDPLSVAEPLLSRLRVCRQSSGKLRQKCGLEWSGVRTGSFFRAMFRLGFGTLGLLMLLYQHLQVANQGLMQLLTERP